MFDSTKRTLRDLLRDAHEGRLQLPDFQRSYVWGDADLRSLLASVGAGYPVGALLTLTTGGPVKFKPRRLEGAPEQRRDPDELLLDGQQRITSLYQATYAPDPVKTLSAQKKPIERYYYLDMRKAVAAPDALEDAIIAMPPDRVLRSNFNRDVELDLSTPALEYANHMFPLNKTFNATDWNFDWRNHWRDQLADLMSLERAFFKDVIGNIANYELPIIRLDRDNSRSAICTIFEKVNVGGKKLDAFELVTAIYAADEFDLRRDWHGPPGAPEPAGADRHARMVGAENPRDVLRPVSSVDFLKACSLLHTRAQREAKAVAGAAETDLPQIACKRDAILALPLSAYRAYSGPVERGFVEAAKFLNARKIIWSGDIPYPDQITVLAAVHAHLGAKAGGAAAQEKLDRWFWSVALGELYGSATDSRLARDLPELLAWIAEDGPSPRSVDEALFRADRLRTMRMRLSAAYKALHALLMRSGCRDFITGRETDLMTFFDDRIDIHHIFPQAWAKRRGIAPGRFNSIVNKAPLFAATNKAIGGDAPSVYLRRIEERQGLTSDQLDAILRSHLIEPELLRADDFDGFFDARLAALSGVVATAMRKPVAPLEDAVVADDLPDDAFEDEEAPA